MVAVVEFLVGTAVFVLVGTAGVGIRIFLGRCDHERIKTYIESRGGRVIKSSWSPFGPGWFGEKSDRIYKVDYVDPEGAEHHAHCKTSMLTGVYFTEDKICSQAKSSTVPRPESIQEENRRLRMELDQLKNRSAKHADD